MLVEEKWQEIIKTVKEEYELSKVVYESWIKPLEIFRIDGDKIYILAPPEQIALNYITKKYLTPLKVVIAEMTGIDYEIEFILPEDAKKMKPAKSTAMQEDAASHKNHDLNPNYTFDTFVVGSNNKLAHTISLVVAEEANNPAKKYNPLFLWGGVGLGKTHLMHSIAHHILANHPNLKIQYVPSEVFTNEVIDAIRNGSNSQINAIRDKYRNVDVLLIDDIQFIIGKDSTQEEFFHTFNALHSAKKQIILSSDKPPKDMEILEERIQSRFEWGLLADIGYPDYETRMAILRRKQETDGFRLDDEILDYISTNIKSNIRELEGALNKLLAFSNLEHTEITMEIAVRELQNIISPDKPKEITPQLVIEIVAEHFNISTAQMISKNRSSKIARPRQIAMYLCKNMTSASLETIGAILGGRDHSTIIHGIKKITEDYEKNEDFHYLLETIKKKINPN